MKRAKGFCPFQFVIVLSVLLLFTASDYLFGIFKLLFVLLPFFFVIVLSVLLFTASDYLFGIYKPLFVLLPFSFCHCIVCPSSIYGFWLPLWYLQVSLCPFALFILSLYCLSFFYWWLLITSLVPSSFSLSLCPFSFVIVLSVVFYLLLLITLEKLEDTKEVIRNRQLKNDRQYNDKRKKAKGQREAWRYKRGNQKQ
jgi:hypothetical protein